MFTIVHSGQNITLYIDAQQMKKVLSSPLLSLSLVRCVYALFLTQVTFFFREERGKHCVAKGKVRYMSKTQGRRSSDDLAILFHIKESLNALFPQPPLSTHCLFLVSLLSLCVCLAKNVNVL